MDKYSVFFKEQCTVLLSREVRAIYDKLEAFNYIPLAPAEGPGVEDIKWRKFSAVGIAKIISEYATDIPSVEVYGEEEKATVRHVAIKYSYNKFEVAKAQKAGVDLTGDRAKHARLGIETKVDEIAWFGDEEYNINGFTDYPGINEYTLGTSATGSSKEWSKKTPEEIVADINGMVDTIYKVTSWKENPNTCIMPPALYRILTTTFIDTDKKTSLLEFLQKCNPSITTWGAVTALTSAGAGGVGRIMVYDKNPDKLEFHLPVPLDQEPEEKSGFNYSAVMTADVGGVTVYYPQSVCFADGALAAS